MFPDLAHQEATLYQLLTGIMRSIVQLSEVDICIEVSMLSSYLTFPIEGHVDYVYHLFSRLKQHHNTEMVLNPSYLTVQKITFEK